MNEKFPTHAQVVIIGGGIVGCSVAYHLCKLGWKDVVLLERKTIASGTTWAAAGLLGQLWSNAALTKLAVYGADLYSRLEEETGQPTGYLRPGSIRVAQTKARKEEYDRSMQMARAFGIEMEEISLKEAKKLFPLLHTGDLEAALDAYRAAERLQADHPELLERMGHLQLLRGQPAEAASVLRRLVRVTPDRAAAWAQLAFALAQTGEAAQAQRALGRAIEIDANDPVVQQVAQQLR